MPNNPKHPHTQDAVAKMLETAGTTTHTEAAAIVGVSPQYLNAVANGNHDIRVGTLSRWATRLGLRQRVYYEKIDPPTS